MPTLTPTQREAYNAFKALWEYRGFSRKRAFDLFKALLGYEDIPYFMELSVPECERIIRALKPENLEPLLAAAGRNTQVCQVCGRELTDPKSKAYGIGPVCRSRLGASKPMTLEDLLK